MRRTLSVLLLAAAVSIPSTAMAKSNPAPARPHASPTQVIGRAWSAVLDFVRSHSSIRPQDDTGGHSLPPPFNPAWGGT
jgi:hypothetical protein